MKTQHESNCPSILLGRIRTAPLSRGMTPPPAGYAHIGLRTVEGSPIPTWGGSMDDLPRFDGAQWSSDTWHTRRTAPLAVPKKWVEQSEQVIDSKCCGKCAHWQQKSECSQRPVGRCTWEPTRAPFCFERTSKAEMLFKEDGKDCPLFKPNAQKNETH